MGNFLRHMRAKRQYRDSQSQQQPGEMCFAPSDLDELQAILWNLLCVDATGRPRKRKEVEATVGELRAECSAAGYAPPTCAELAPRLLVDTIEREEESRDMHVVHKLESEEQVLALLFEPVPQQEGDGAEDEYNSWCRIAGCEMHRIKRATIEVLMWWYVHTIDCEDMLRLMDEMPAAQFMPEGGGATTRTDATAVTGGGDGEDLQSFVWQGSQLLDAKSPVSDEGAFSDQGTPENGPSAAPGTPVARSFCGSFAPALLGDAAGEAMGQRRTRRSSASPPQRRAEPCSAATRCAETALAPSNAALVAQLAYCIKVGLRAALRTYSTAHFSTKDEEHTRAAQREAGPEWSSSTHTAMKRTVDLNQRDELLLPPPSTISMTVVLDLDETLIYARRGPLWVRPGVYDFLRDLKRAKCEVVCWTASNRSYAGGILSKLDPHAEIVSQCIYAHPKWQRSSVRHQVKNLHMLSRDLSRTLIIDNLPDAVSANPENAIVVEDYEGCEKHGTTLPTASKLVQQCAQSGLPVPEFLRSVATAAADAALKCCERQLASGEVKWFYILNSEPEKFMLPL
eukprot:TRINITY_DN9762_c0_g1_i1.p1 TRINITY_DN9762_c0_g1~~TRINITY_DN9762_c0_g1_i1.p1  ORF type:complete len:568 (+),score=201.92 TRINITY_DN9762_c0_g1_i1:77-1780(+)